MPTKEVTVTKREQKITDDQLYNPSLTVGLWYEVGAPIAKFTLVGEYLTGIWMGSEPSQYGQVGIVQGPDGSVRRFSITVMLRDRLQQIKVGSAITIIFTGFKPVASNPDHMQKMYRVFVPDPTDIQTAAPIPRARSVPASTRVRSTTTSPVVRRFRRMITED